MVSFGSLAAGLGIGTVAEAARRTLGRYVFFKLVQLSQVGTGGREWGVRREAHV